MEKKGAGLLGSRWLYTLCDVVCNYHLMMHERKLRRSQSRVHAGPNHTCKP